MSVLKINTRKKVRVKNSSSAMVDLHPDQSFTSGGGVHGDVALVLHGDVVLVLHGDVALVLHGDVALVLHDDGGGAPL